MMEHWHVGKRDGGVWVAPLHPITPPLHHYITPPLPLPIPLPP
jgi:hypothetical protein